MSRILAVGGIHLDRAWPELGAEWGGALRGWSRQVLARVIEQAREHDAEAVVVLGNLLDRSTVLPDTVEYAAAVLGSFAGRVLIAPGQHDWIGDAGPYELGSWPANVHVWNSGDFQPAPTMPMWWGSAWTSPSGWTPRPPKDTLEGATRTFVWAGLASDLGELSVGDQTVTTGPVTDPKMKVLADVVCTPGTGIGSALLIDTGNVSADPTVIRFPGEPGTVVQLDVDDLRTQEEFEVALKNACTATGPLLLQLRGELASSILLPGFGGPELAPNVIVDLDRLGYGAQAPVDWDRSTRAEFLRAMALTRGDERERHQTTALGLRALSASNRGH